jgi:hypothetical protein
MGEKKREKERERSFRKGTQWHVGKMWKIIQAADPAQMLNVNLAYQNHM